MAIRVQLRPHREGIAALEKDGFQVEPVRFSRGDHLLVRVTRDGASGQVPISGSPGGLFIHSLVRDARRAVREAKCRA